MVMHRGNNRPWLIVVEVADLIRLLDVVDAHRAKIDDQSDSGAVGQSDSEAAATTVTNDGGGV